MIYNISSTLVNVFSPHFSSHFFFYFFFFLLMHTNINITCIYEFYFPIIFILLHTYFRTYTSCITSVRICARAFFAVSTTNTLNTIRIARNCLLLRTTYTFTLLLYRLSLFKFFNTILCTYVFCVCECITSYSCCCCVHCVCCVLRLCRITWCAVCVLCDTSFSYYVVYTVCFL